MSKVTGALTEEQVERVGRKVAEMVKAARSDPHFLKEAKEKLSLDPTLKRLLGNFGTGAGVGLGMAGGAKAIGLISEKLHERNAALDKAKYYQEMLKANPDLGETGVDSAMVQRHYDTLHKFNPEYASDPMVAGAYVRTSLRFAMPNLDQLNNVVRARQSLVEAKQKSKPGIPGAKLIGAAQSLTNKFGGM